MSILGIGPTEHPKEANNVGGIDNMKGIVISESENGFTFLSDIFKSIGNVQRDYNWLISDFECYPCSKEYSDFLSGNWCWMTGTELTEMVSYYDFQWIWGVFSGFPKNVTKHEVLQYNLPIANGNQRIWKNPISIQHPLAVIEMIAWDSSAAVFISKNDNLVAKLSATHLPTEDLEQYNATI